MIRPATRHLLEFAAGLAGLFAVLAGLLVWRLSSGPISLDLIAPNISDMLSEAVGTRVDIEEASLNWSKDVGAFDIAVRHVRLYDAEGALVAEAPHLDLRFDIGSIFNGVGIPTRVDMVGASAIVARSADGRFHLGFVPLPASVDSEEGGPAASPLASVKKRGVGDYILSVLLAPPASSALAQLTSFAARDASVIFYDEQSQSLWRATEGEFLFRRTPTGAQGEVLAQLQLEGGPVAFSAEGSFDRARQEANVTVTVSELTLAQLASNSPLFSPLRRITVPISGQASLTLGTDGRVRQGDATLIAAQGMLDLDGLKIKEAGKPFRDSDPEWAKSGPYAAKVIHPPPLGSVQIDGATLEAEFDAEKGRVAIHQLSIAGPQNWANFSGEIFLRPPQEESEVTGHRLAIDLHSEDSAFYVPGVVGAPVLFDDLSVSVSMDRSGDHLFLDDLSFSIDGSTANLKGVITKGYAADGRFSPAVDLKGRVRHVPVETVVKLWPVFTGMGAREWLSKNMSGTQITRGEFMMNAPAGVLGQGPLPNDVLRFDFAFKGGTVTYIPGLTPLKDLSGSATLYGNRFNLSIDQGRVGNIRVVHGEVDIPRLTPKGATATYSADISGEISEILDLIDMPPLRLTRKFGIDQDIIGGTADVHLKIGRPMWRRVPIEVVTYDVTALTHGFSLPQTVADLSMTNGAFKLSIDNQGILARGPFDWEGVPAFLTWTERFGLEDKSAPSTAYEITLDVEAAEYAKLGLNITGLARGPISTTIRTTGKGMAVRYADIQSDLTQTVLTIAPLGWSKEAGLPASLRLKFVPGAQGERRFENLVMTGDQMDIRGDMTLARDYRLLQSDFPVFKLGDRVDFRLKADRRKEDDGFVLDVQGERLDVGAIVKEYFAASGDTSSSTPVQISGAIATLFLNEGVVLNNAQFQFAGNGERLTRFDVEGDFPEGGSVFAALTGPANGRRHLVVSSTDAGAVARGLFGYTSLVGGTLDLSAHFEPPALREATGEAIAKTEEEGEPTGDAVETGGPELGLAEPSSPPEETSDVVYGSAEVRDFRVVNLPLLAQLLSAGSFSGLADLLNGEGLAFDKMEVPFVIEGSRMEFSQTRAVGSSLGVTMEGVYDRKSAEVDFKGTLAPAYTLNSVLGEIPLVGDLFVSRKGEGLLALTYRIKGPIDHARVFVNPLSAFAPGFFRRLFQLGRRNVVEPPHLHDPAEFTAADKKPDSSGEDPAAALPTGEEGVPSASGETPAVNNPAAPRPQRKP